MSVITFQIFLQSLLIYPEISGIVYCTSSVMNEYCEYSSRIFYSLSSLSLSLWTFSLIFLLLTECYLCEHHCIVFSSLAWFFSPTISICSLYHDTRLCPQIWDYSFIERDEIWWAHIKFGPFLTFKSWLHPSLYLFILTN